ncbi:HEPN domain-containing protein [Parapedobacter soli]|uniref:HEPN domain-containing protein n=1 Tax=Parapedobacter soli TaxID=416955 RepID=UPI0021C732C6|nr:HEPN domain-containing protein [Parapedobacter soli]
MDINLDDLSAAQQAALRRLAKQLTTRLPIAFVFCFALQRYEVRYANCFAPDKLNKQWFHAAILLVYNEHEQYPLQDIHHIANSVEMGEHQYVAVAMTYTEAMQQLANGDAFVGTVFQCGALLHSRANTLPQRRMFVCHETLLKQTREGWRRWFNNSCQFMDCACYCLMEDKFSMAVFMLHQTVEQACKAMLKVMLYIRPSTHNLAWMLKLCGTIAPEITSIFPRDTPEDKTLFNLLKSSYMDSRYAAGFEVNENEAWTLYHRTSTLLRIAGELCNKRIAELEVLVGESVN